MKSYLAEFLGTFMLVFFAAGSALIDAQTNGAVSLIGCAAASGLIVTAVIYSFGNVSGAHINPAVTIGFSVAGLFSKKEILPYVSSQLAGSFAAGMVLKFLFPESQSMGATLPSGEVMQSFILEIILTFLLMLVILHTSQGIKEIQQLAGIIIGGMVLLEIIFAGPISGGSMNPARSFGPAIAAGNISTLWIYFVSPVIGASMATFVWKYLKPETLHV